MLPLAFNKQILLLFSASVLALTLLLTFHINPVPLNSVYAQSSGYCENGWTFNGGDAGDDSNWEYTGCGQDDGGDNDEDEDENSGGVEEGYCENGWTFNGGDAGNDDNWEYTGCGQDDDENSCEEDEWTDEETSGEYECRDGEACFRKWSRDESCDIDDEGWDCKEDDRCGGSIQPGYCENGWTFNGGDAGNDDNWAYTGCGIQESDNQEIQPGYCEGGWTFNGGDAGDDSNWIFDNCGQDESAGACPSNQYWDTNSGGCVDPTPDQTDYNDSVYCQEQCGGSCAGERGAKYCTNPDGSQKYDCSDPNQQWLAECQNQLLNEFNNVGIEHSAGAGDLAAQNCGFADLEGGECRGAEYCRMHILYCNGEPASQPKVGGNCSLMPGLCGVAADEKGNLFIQRPACNPECGAGERCMDDGNGAGFCQALENIPANPADPCEADPNSVACQAAQGEQSQVESFQNGCENRSGEYYTECNWKTHSVQAVCSYSGQYDTKDLGQQGGVCNAPAEVGNKAYCANVNCGSGFHCEVSSSNAAECKPDYGGDGQPVVSEENTSKPLVQAPVEIPARCRDIINPDRLDECIQREAGQTPGGGQTDASCQAQTPDENYCDGNVCIQKSAGWDGNNCVPVYKSVPNSFCNNACSGDSAQSGQTVKLVNCLDARDDTSREECKAENTRIIQSGREVEAASRIKASLSLENCSALEGEAKEACENKNSETQFLAKVLDSVQLENCAGKNNDEKAACDARNSQAIRQGQARLNLGIEDCSGLTGDQKTNCEFTNYQRDQIAQAAAAFVPEDCAKYQNEAEVLACNQNNQTRYSQAVNNFSPFVGLAEVGASCVYTEACEGGAQKACAGKVANDNGAPVCRYDPNAASCSACTTSPINLRTTENKCSDDGQTCLNGPGYYCRVDADCQKATQAAQQAAANAPIDPAKYFSQQFEEGVACKQVQACEDGQEQVCEGKGAGGACDLSQGGGICSPCQAKGTVTLNRVATCNPETYKCEGAPALSGCSNDDQCKPVVTNVTSRTPVGAGQVVGSNGNIFDTRTVCREEIVEFNTFVGNLDSQYGNDLDGAIYDHNAKREKIQKCYEQHYDTGRAATVTTQVVTQNTEYYYAERGAANATNRLDQYEASVARGAEYGPSDSIDTVLQYQAEQQKAVERLQQAEAALGIVPQASLALDRSTADAQVAAYTKLNQIRTTEIEIARDLAETTAARNEFNQVSIGSTADSEAVAIRYDEFEKARAEAQEKINQLAVLRGESGKGVSQQYQNQLDLLPTRADEQFQDNQTERQATQLANLARSSKSPEVISSAEEAIVTRVQNAEARGKTELAAGIKQQGIQAAYTGWSNIYADELLKPGGDSEKGGTYQSQEQIQRLIAETKAVDPQSAQRMQNEYEALPSYVQAVRLAEEIKRETVGTFIGTDTQDNNSAFYSVIANAEEQAKSREDLANLIDRTCSLSEQRCNALRAGFAVDDPLSIPDMVVNTSLSSGSKAANLISEHRDLMPQLYALERAGETSNPDEAARIVGRAAQIASELDQIDPNIGANLRAQTRETSAQGQAQNEVDFAANTYANNKSLMLALNTAKNNGVSEIATGITPEDQIAAAQGRMQLAIEQMREVNPTKADAMQSDLALTNFKIDSLPRGSELGNTDGCVVETCNGNSSSAQNICSGEVASAPKTYNPFCASQNGVIDPATAWRISADASREDAINTQAASIKSTNNFWSGVTSGQVISDVSNAAPGLWEAAKGIPSGAGQFIGDWFARDIESHTPTFLGDAEKQNSCRANTTIIPFFGGGTVPPDCQIDNRTQDEKNQLAAEVTQNGGRIADILESISGAKASSPVTKRTLDTIAEESGVDLSVPVLYWTETQRAKFNEKLKSYYSGGLVDTFDSVVFPSTALRESQVAATQCEREWGKDLCELDPSNASSFIAIAQGDEDKYKQTLASARALTPAVGEVPQSDFNWVVTSIANAQSGNLLGDITGNSNNNIRRDQFESDEEYYSALAVSNSSSSQLTRDQLIDQLLIDANISGLAPGGQPKTREEIASAVNAYLAIGYYGKNVVGASPSYAWQRSANNEYNLQTALTTVGLVTMAGPLEVLDPTGPAVQLVAKGIGNIFSPVVNVASRAVGGVAERVAVQGAEQAIRSSYGVSDTAGINAVKSYLGARVGGQTVDQAISTLTPVQQSAFTRATSEIAQTLGLTNTSDRIIASTVLDSVLTPQVVESASIAQRGSVLADLTLQAQSTGTLTREVFEQLASTPVRENGGRPLITAVEVDALADQGIFDTPALSPIQHQIAARQAVESTLEAAGVLPSIQQAQVEQMIAGLKERVAIPVGPLEEAARPRIINGVSDGIRVGQATDGENAIISRLLAPDPVSRQDASGLARTWNELPQQEKDLLIAQAAREAQIDRQAAVQFAQTPISGNQAFVQLGSQAEAFVSGVPAPAVTRAVAAAKNIIPQVEDAVIRATQGQDLTAANESALRLAGVSEPGLRTVVGDLTEGQKAGLVRAIQSNPEILSSPDLESALVRQGLTTEESQSVKLTLQNMSPTPVAAGNTPSDDIFTRISQAWDIWKADVPVSSNITEPSLADNQISPVVVQIDQPSPVVQLRDSVVNTPGCPVAGVFSQSTLAAASANSNVLGIQLGRCPLERTLIDNPLLGRVIGWGDSAYDGAFSSGIRWADQILFNTSPAVEKMALKATQLTETALEKSPIGNLIRASDTPNLTDEGDYFIYLTKNGAPTLDKPSADSVPILVRVSPSGNGTSVVSEVVLPRSLETNPQSLIAVEKMTGQTITPSLVTSNEDQLLSQLADASAYKYFPVNTVEDSGLTAQVNDRLASAREWIDQNILRTDPEVDTPSLSPVDNSNPCPIGFSGTSLALDEVDPNSNVLAARSTCPDPIQRQRASDALGKVINQFNDPSVRGTPGRGVTADIFRRRGVNYGVQPEFSPREGVRKSKYIFEVTSPDQLKPNGLYNYVLTDDGRIFVSDRRALRNEEGIKHIQIAGEVWQVGQNGVAARPDIGIIRSGEIVVDPYGRLLIDLESGTFSEYGKQIGWKTTPSNFSDLEDIFEGRLGVRPLAVSRATSPSRVSIMEAEARAATVFGMRDQVRVNNLNTALFNATNELNQIRSKIGNPDLLSEVIGHARAARQRALDAIDAASTPAEKNAASDVMRSSISLNEEINKQILKSSEVAKKEVSDLGKTIKDLHAGIKKDPSATGVAGQLGDLEIKIQVAKTNVAKAEKLLAEAQDLANVASYDKSLLATVAGLKKVVDEAQKAADEADKLFNEAKKLADEAASVKTPPSAAGAAPGSASAPPPPPGMVDELTKHYDGAKAASLDAYKAAQSGNAEDAIAAAEKVQGLLDQARKTAGSNTSREVTDLLKRTEAQLNAAIGQAKQAAKAQADQIEAGAKAAQSTSADGVKKANQAAEDARNGAIAASRKQAKEAADQAASARKTQIEAEAKAVSLESGAAKTSNPDIKAEAIRARQAANEAKKAADEVEAAARNAEKAVTEAIEKMARETQAELDGMAGKNFYEILGIPNTATESEIRTAFRNASKKYHPDNNPTAPAAEVFKKMDAAYKVLSNKRDRRIYDILGHERYVNPGGAPPGGAGSAGRPPGAGSTPPGGAGSTPPGGSAGTPPGSAGSAGTPPGGAGASAGTPPGSAGSAGTPPGASAGTPPGAGASAGTPPGAGAAGAAGTRTGTGTVEDVLNEMLAQDLYARLGINRSASKRDILSAYRKLALEFHPDVNKDPNAADVFKLIQEAYDILKDPSTRANYNSGRYRPRGGWAADGVRNRRASARAGAAGAAGTPPGGAGSAGSAGTPPGGSAGTPPGAGASGGAGGGASAGTPPGGAGSTPPGGSAGAGAAGSAGSAGTPPGAGSYSYGWRSRGATPPGGASAGTPPGAGAAGTSGTAAGSGTPPGSSSTVRASMRVNQAVAVGLVGGTSGALIYTGACIVYDFPFCFGAFSDLSASGRSSAGSTPPTTTPAAGGLIAPIVVPTTAVIPTTAVPTAVTPPTVIPVPPTVSTVGAPTGRSGSGDEGATAPTTPTDNNGRSGSGDEGAIAPVQPQTTTPVVKPGNQIGQNLAPGSPLVATPQSPGGASTSTGSSGSTATPPVTAVNPTINTPATSQSQTPASTNVSTPQNPPAGSTTNVAADPVSPIQAGGVLTPVNPSPTGIQPIPVLAVPESVPSVVRAVASGPVAVVNNLIATINQLIAPGVTPSTIPATPPAIAPITVIYDGPGCWGTHSVIMKLYSNGSEQYLRDYGVIPGECGNPSPSVCGAQQTVMQCGGDIGLDDKDPSHIYEVTPTYNCETQQISYQETDKGVSQQCQNSGLTSKDKKIGESCQVNEQCQTGLICDLLYTQTCVQKVNKIEVYEDTSKECDKIQTGDIACYKEEGIYKGHQVKISREKKGNSGCSVAIIDYGPGKCQ